MKWRYLLNPEGSRDPGLNRLVEALEGYEKTHLLVADPTAHRVLQRRTEGQLARWMQTTSPRCWPY